MRTILFVTLLSSLVVLAQDKEIKKVPVTRTANSGKEMFGAYCAPCHGLDGTGSGPAGVGAQEETGGI